MSQSSENDFPMARQLAIFLNQTNKYNLVHNMLRYRGTSWLIANHHGLILRSLKYLHHMCAVQNPMTGDLSSKICTVVSVVFMYNI